MSIRARVEAIENECEGCWSLYGITSWERGFIEDLKTYSRISVTQEQILQQIENKAGIDNDE